MGQFVVVDTTQTGTKEVFTENDFVLFPNPASNRLFVKFNDISKQAYYIRITNILGRTLMMLPQPELSNGIDISVLPAGTYFLQLTDLSSKKTVVKKFVVE
jgi:hypothetical protein